MTGEKLKGWRKIAFTQWRSPDQPGVFGALEIDATNLLAFMTQTRAAGHRVTPTHLVGRALAKALHDVPDMNVRIVAGRAVPRPSVDIFFITAVEGGRDLSGARIDRADDKPATEIAAELTERARALKARKDPNFTKTKRITDALPGPLLGAALRITSFVTGDLGLSVPSLGLPASPFGSAMVTSVGMLGLPMGFAPLSWMYTVPILVLAGEIADKPMVVDGPADEQGRRAKVVGVRPVLPISATIDHRYADGWHISQLLRPFRAYLEEPAAFEPALPAAPG